MKEPIISTIGAMAVAVLIMASGLAVLAQQPTPKEPSLPPLPPGLPADTAKAAPVKQLTDREKAAAKEANEAARMDRLRLLSEFEKKRHIPLKTPDGEAATLTGLADSSRHAFATSRRRHPNNTNLRRRRLTNGWTSRRKRGRLTAANARC